MAASFLFALPTSVSELGPTRTEQIWINFGRTIAPALRAAGLAGPVANTGPWGIANYLSYFLGAPFYGGMDAPTAEQAAASCARLLVARRGSRPDEVLAASSLFRDLDGAVPGIARTRWRVFENRKRRSDCPPGPR